MPPWMRFTVAYVTQKSLGLKVMSPGLLTVVSVCSPTLHSSSLSSKVTSHSETSGSPVLVDPGPGSPWFCWECERAVARKRDGCCHSGGWSGADGRGGTVLFKCQLSGQVETRSHGGYFLFSVGSLRRVVLFFFATSSSGRRLFLQIWESP